jgi:hypothetical protein
LAIMKSSDFECRNEKCLHRKQSSQKQGLTKKPAASDIVQCLQCPDEDAKKFQYCSMLCLRQDWNLRHWHECRGNAQTKKKAQRLDPEEVRKIEKTTPFIKLGQLKTADQIESEKLLAKATLEDLIFEEKPLGRGSYGVV